MGWTGAGLVVWTTSSAGHRARAGRVVWGFLWVLEEKRGMLGSDSPLLETARGAQCKDPEPCFPDSCLRRSSPWWLTVQSKLQVLGAMSMSEAVRGTAKGKGEPSSLSGPFHCPLCPADLWVVRDIIVSPFHRQGSRDPKKLATLLGQMAD